LRSGPGDRIFGVGLSTAPLVVRGGPEQQGRIGASAVGHFWVRARQL